MLEGMAPPQARATREEAGRLLLYTPVVTDADFAASIAYLARRLDENAGPENFLRALFTITPGSPEWDDQRASLRARRRPAATTCRRRRAATRTAPPSTARSIPTRRSPTSPTPTSPQRANRDWIARHLAADRPAPRPPLVTTAAGIDAIVERAGAGAARWRATSTARAPRGAVPPRRGDGRRSWADDRRDGPRDGQDGPRGRPRGVGGDRLRDVGGGVHPPARRARVVRDRGRPARRRARRRAVELPARDPHQRRRRRPRRRQRGAAEAGAGGRCGRHRDRPPRPRRRHPRRRRAARPLPRRRHRPPPRDPPRRRWCRAHRLLRHGSAVPRLATRPPPAGRDQRQERARRQPDRRRRPRLARPRALGVRARRPEVLGRLARHRRGPAARRHRLPRPPRRRRPQPARRPAHRPRDDDGTGHHPASRPARAGPDGARPRRVVARRAATARRRRTAVVTRCPHRRAARVVVPPHRVLRARARRHPRRRPRPRRRHPERRRLRPDRRTAQPRRSRDRALARAGRGRQRLRQPPHHRGDRAAPAVRRVEALVGGPWRQDGRTRRRRPVRDVPPHRRCTDARRRRGVVPASVDRAVRPGDRPQRAAQRAQRAALPAGRHGRGARRRRRPPPTTSPRWAWRPRSPAWRWSSSKQPEDDAALAARLATSGAARLRLLADVDDAVLVACHDAGIAVDRTPVTHDGRVELPCWLREQSISWTLHRHGRIPSHHGQP